MPKAGDVALFEIIECGKHWSVQGHENRNVAIFPGDRILAAFADRYATSQFEGYERDDRSIREGTVTISMIDGKTDKTVWQGWTTDEVNSRNLTSREIQSSVRSIFKKFDIAKN